MRISPGNHPSIYFLYIAMPRVLLLAALLIAPAFSQACSCIGPRPVCSAYWQSQVVFRGRVVEQTLVSPTNETVRNLDGTYSTIQGPGYYRVRFSVVEIFRGESQSKEIDILTNEQSSACGFPFVTGAEYLVFTSANEKTNELWTSSCSRTHELEPGVEDADVAWMRALATAPKAVTIYGTVIPTPNSTASNPVATIHLSGPESHNAVPDQTGKYSFPNLPPGEYSISATLPAGFTTDANRTVTVVEKGCAQIDWHVRYDGHIRGIVRDADGRTLPDIFVVLQRRDSNSATGFADIDLKNTGPDGRYDFALVPPGDYLVSANHLGPSPTRPYPRIYYPSAESDSTASVIHLAASGTADNIDVVLSNAWKTVTVHARVLLADGSPAIGADVNAYDINFLNSGEPSRADSDADGRATLSVYEGRTYYLVATISAGTQQRCAGPLKFAAKDGVVVETIMINHNWGNCLAQLNPEFQAPR
ncbi:MAG: carboxypeptidase regulatory-like domain-containing protein [Candidatus Acidiferrum sp.]